jgi:hypothetical protein
LDQQAIEALLQMAEEIEIDLAKLEAQIADRSSLLPSPRADMFV